MGESDLKRFNEFLIINFGLFLVALGIYLFKIPNNFAIGGVSGIAIVVGRFFPGSPVGLIMMAINILLTIAGIIFVGFSFGFKTIYSSFALSGMVWLLEKIYPISKPLTRDTILELVYAVILPAVGSAIVFNKNASTGGTDIIAKILAKYMRINIGKTLLLGDFIITVMAGMVFGIEIGMYSILGLFLKGFIIDFVIEELNLCKQVVIISANSDQVKKYITENIKRGATVYKAIGAFTNQEKEVITTIVTRKQAVKLRDYIGNADPKAFVTITNTSEIIGKGFRNVVF